MLPRMSHHHGHHHAHDAEAEFNEFYSQRPQTWSGNPNATLVAEATDLTPGRALDVGCGEGADAVWLAERFPGRLWIAVELHAGPDDASRLAELQSLGEACGLPLVYCHRVIQAT